jgi:hypothetical protein
MECKQKGSMRSPFLPNAINGRNSFNANKKAMSRSPWLFEGLVGYGQSPCPPMAFSLLFQKEQGRPDPKAIKAKVRTLQLHSFLH